MVDATSCDNLFAMIFYIHMYMGKGTTLYGEGYYPLVQLYLCIDIKARNVSWDRRPNTVIIYTCID